MKARTKSHKARLASWNKHHFDFIMSDLPRTGQYSTDGNTFMTDCGLCNNPVPSCDTANHLAIPCCPAGFTFTGFTACDQEGCFAGNQRAICLRDALTQLTPCSTTSATGCALPLVDSVNSAGTCQVGSETGLRWGCVDINTEPKPFPSHDDDSDEAPAEKSNKMLYLASGLLLLIIGGLLIFLLKKRRT